MEVSGGVLKRFSGEVKPQSNKLFSIALGSGIVLCIICFMMLGSMGRYANEEELSMGIFVGVIGFAAIFMAFLGKSKLSSKQMSQVKLELRTDGIVIVRPQASNYYVSYQDIRSMSIRNGGAFFTLISFENNFGVKGEFPVSSEAKAVDICSYIKAIAEKKGVAL